MASSNAWILPLDETLNTAVGEFEIIHLVHYPALFSVPGAPYYCNQVLVWQKQILPALDLSAWLWGRPMQHTPNLAAVATYPDPDGGEPQYAGLLLADIPRQTLVDDSQACDLPGTPAGWRQLSISCFRDNEQTVPIIDLQTVFSGALMHSQ